MKAHIHEDRYDLESPSACGTTLADGDRLISQRVAHNVLFHGPSPFEKITAQQLCEDCLDTIGQRFYEGYEPL